MVVLGSNIALPSSHSKAAMPSPILSPTSTSTLRVTVMVASSSSTTMINSTNITSSNSSPMMRRKSSISSSNSLGQVGGVPENIHPAVSQLGLMYSKHRIVGGNARCLALLRVFKKVIQDYYPPPGVSISRHLDAALKPQIAWLVKSRPLSVSMAHAIRHLKWQIAHLPPSDSTINETDSLLDVKNHLYRAIDSYIRERIELADQLIVSLALNRIEGESLLLYSHSDVILDLLVTATQSYKKFSLVVVDSAPLFEGQEVLKSLRSRLGDLIYSIPISYVLLSGIGHVLRNNGVTRVLMGANCIYSNGNVQSRSGSSLVAMMAHQANVPVIVLCETYKFSDKVQLSSLSTMNEEVMTNVNNIPNLHSTISLHDIISSKFVSMIITEIGMIPCTSVPVVLREYRPFPI